jgi:hypothetical protein
MLENREVLRMLQGEFLHNLALPSITLICINSEISFCACVGFGYIIYILWSALGIDV